MTHRRSSCFRAHFLVATLALGCSELLLTATAAAPDPAGEPLTTGRPSSRESTLAGSSVHVDGRKGTDSATCGVGSSGPCKTISKGIARCAAQKPCTVLVADGRYRLTEPIGLEDKISLAGGYKGGKPASRQSWIEAPRGGAPALTAKNVTSTVEGFILQGTTPTDPARASVVILAKASHLTLSNVAVHAATGANAPPGAAGRATPGGNANGRDGGKSNCGTPNNGGDGGAEWNITTRCTGSTWNGCSYLCDPIEPKNAELCGKDGEWGQAGQGGPNSRGSCHDRATHCLSVSQRGGFGTACCTVNNLGSATPAGNAGQDGAPGPKPAGRSANRIGHFDRDATWAPSVGDPGRDGYDAGGGGGGGAGIARINTGCNIKHCKIKPYNGMPGGGGGGGGCGAKGGRAGAMGGASFGILLVDSTLEVGDELKISGAQGGSGGDGGAGVSGGNAGKGAPGCNFKEGGCNTTVQSGAGGDGGRGGASGGGAGGNGGPSIGIVLLGSSVLDGSPSIYPGQSGRPGEGGQGGTGSGIAPDGQDGQEGLAQSVYSGELGDVGDR